MGHALSPFASISAHVIFSVRRSICWYVSPATVWLLSVNPDSSTGTIARVTNPTISTCWFSKSRESALERCAGPRPNCAIDSNAIASKAAAGASCTRFLSRAKHESRRTAAAIISQLGGVQWLALLVNRAQPTPAAKANAAQSRGYRNGRGTGPGVCAGAGVGAAAAKAQRVDRNFRTRSAGCPHLAQCLRLASFWELLFPTKDLESVTFRRTKACGAPDSLRRSGRSAMLHTAWVICVPSSSRLCAAL